MFSHLTLNDVDCHDIRSIVFLRSSQDLFDDLTSSPEAWMEIDTAAL